MFIGHYAAGLALKTFEKRVSLGVLFRWVVVKNNSVAIVVALAVFSHWALDLIVHTPDLPLWNDASMKLGFGLWNNAIATYALEAVILIVALWAYLRSTSATTTIGKSGMIIFVIFLLLANVVNVFGPLQGDSQLIISLAALTSYFLFAAVAFWLNSKRF